jgi:hypothetical protein
MNNEQSVWTYRIKDASGTVLCNLVAAQDRKLRIGLNKAGEASFSYDMKDFFLLAQKLSGRSVNDLAGLAYNSLEVLRNGTLLWAGEMYTMERGLDPTERTLDFKALGYLWKLGYRYIGLTSDVTHTAKDAGQIVVDTVNAIQAETYGNMGFSFGTVQTSVNRTMVLSRKNVKELIEELSGTENGFDFDISPTKVINIYYPIKGADKTDYVEFKYPGNIESITEIRDANELANYVFAVGKGTGDQELNVTREDVSSESSTIGKRVTIESYKDVENATVLGDIAQQVLNARHAIQPLYKIKLIGNATPSLDMYSVGDIVRVTVQDEYWQFSQVFRVFEIFIDIDENDKEDVTIVVGLI